MESKIADNESILPFRTARPRKTESHKRDKRKNTVEFNLKAKKRREKAKHDAKARKINQRRAKR